MAKQLTAKQEKFCQNVASGMTYRDAYINAYDTKKNSENAIRTEAYKLSIRDDIKDRIKALTRPIEDAFKIQGLSERENQIKYIKNRLSICENNDDETSIIKYTDMLNKIYGIYKETQDNIKQDNNKLDKIDDNTLKKLIAI